jgi:hypothetical protein
MQGNNPMPRSEEFDNLRDSLDGLDKIEHLMALREKVIDEINADPLLTDEERRRLIMEVERRIEDGDWDGETRTMVAHSQFTSASWGPADLRADQEVLPSDQTVTTPRQTLLPSRPHDGSKARSRAPPGYGRSVTAIRTGE